MSINNSRQSIRSIRKSMLRKRRKGAICFTLLIGLIVAASAYFAFVQNGFSLENQPICGIEEHIHEESCYFAPELICGKDETMGHTHLDTCYDEDSNLICERVEAKAHIHYNKCYYVKKELICEKEETEWVGRAASAKTNKSDEEIEWHKHVDECYHAVLVCELEEHTHNAACYAVKGENAAGISKLNQTVHIFSSNSITDTTILSEETEGSHVSEEPPSSEEPAVPEEYIATDTSLEETETLEPEKLSEENADISETEATADEGSTNPSSTSSGKKGSSSGLKENVINDDNAPADEEPADPSLEEKNSGNTDGLEEDATGEVGVPSTSSNRVKIVPFSAIPEPDPPDPVIYVKLLINKTVEGEGAIKALEEMGTNASKVFRVEAKIYDNVSNTAGETVGYVEFMGSDFNGGSSSEKIMTIPVMSYGISHFIISEVGSTAGDVWIYTDKEYKIEVNVVEDTGAVTVNDIATKETLYRIRYTASTHSPKPSSVVYPNLNIGDKFKVRSEHHLPSEAIYPRETAYFELTRIETDNDMINAICAEPDKTYPSHNTDGNYTVLDDRDDTVTALAAALFDYMIGAELGIEDFKIMFGLEGKVISQELRRTFMQNAAWEYERYILRLESGSVTGDWNPTMTMFGSYLDNFFLSDQSNYMQILTTLYKMFTEYKKTSGYGDSITSLTLKYTENSTNSASIKVGYTGYIPQVSKLVLTWTGNAEVTVNGVTPPFTNGNIGVQVKAEDAITVKNLSNSVKFTLRDDYNYFLIRGSLLGDLIDSPIIYGEKGYQNLISGIAQFVKLSASVEIEKSKIPFINFYTMVELPATLGLGIDKFLITGTILMLASATLLFTQGIKPLVQQSIHDKNKARLISLVGKRTRKRWFSGRQRE